MHRVQGLGNSFRQCQVASGDSVAGHGKGLNKAENSNGLFLP